MGPTCQYLVNYFETSSVCSEKSPYFVEGVERLKLAHLAMNASVFPAALASSGASQEMVFFTELLCKKKVLM